MFNILTKPPTPSKVSNITLTKPREGEGAVKVDNDEVCKKHVQNVITRYLFLS